MENTINNLFGRPVPKLGFGCMRLPENQNGEYIMDECQAMFDYAMAHGINYFDSAWHYIASQQVIGQCLAKYPRESYILVGKLCFFDGTLESIKAAEQAFERELYDARTNYMDLELIHALGNPGSLERVDELNVWDFMKKLKASGRVKHIGISFHSYPENLERVLSKHTEIEVVQIQANYYDHNTSGAMAIGGSYETYEICRKYQKSVIIMEPIKGGTLATVAQHPEVKKCLTMSCLNMLNQFNNPRMTRMKYYPAIEKSSPRDCRSCGNCEQSCPQKLPIMQLIREADEKLYIGEGIDLWANH